MAFRPIGGGTGGGAPALGQADNIFGADSGSGSVSTVTIAPDLATAEATRDTYNGNNAGWKDSYLGLELNIILYYEIGADMFIQYQQNIGGNWTNIGAPVDAIKGDTGAAGATGNSYFFASIGTVGSDNETERDGFFSISPNSTLLNPGQPVVVNIGNDTESTFLWGGTVEAPVTYDPELWRLSSKEVNSGSLLLGQDGASVNSASQALGFIGANSETSLLIGTPYTDAGSTAPLTPKLATKATLQLTNVFDTQLPKPQTYTLATTNDQLFVGYAFRPADAGELRVEIFLGTDDTGPKIVDSYHTIVIGQVGTEVLIETGNDIEIDSGQDLFIRASGIDLFGGVQTAGPLIGQNVIYNTADTQLYIKNPLAVIDNGILDVTPPAEFGQAAIQLDRFDGVPQYTVGIVDLGAGNPVIPSVLTPSGVSYQYATGGGTKVDFTFTGDDLQHQFNKSGPAYFALSDSGPAKDLGFRVYGEGNEGAALFERITFGWDNDSSPTTYTIETDAFGAGTQRNLDIRVPKLTLNGSDIHGAPQFNGPVLEEASTSGFDAPKILALKDRALFGFGSGSDITVHDLSDFDNIHLINTVSSPDDLAIQTYEPSAVAPTQTRVNSTGSNIPFGAPVTINLGTYSGGYTAVRTDEVNGDWFDIDTPFVDSPAGTNVDAGIQGQFTQVRRYGDFIFAASDGDDFFIFRIDGGTLFRTGGLYNDPKFASIRDIVVYGNYAYIICADAGAVCGISVIDVSNTFRPEIVNEVAQTDRYFKGNITNDVLYVTNANDGVFTVKAYSLQDSLNPVEIGSKLIANPDQNNNGVTFRGNVAYLINFTDSRVTSLDISDPTNMIELDTITVTGSPFWMDIFGNHLILTKTGTPEVQWIDISDPSALALSPVFTDTGAFTGIGQPLIEGNLLYLPSDLSGGSTEGLLVYSLGGYTGHTADIQDINTERLTVQQELDIANAMTVGGAARFDAPVAMQKIGSIADRLLYGLPNNVVPVRSAAELPAPSGGVIQLKNRIYFFYNPIPDIATGPFTIQISDTIVPAPTGQSAFLCDQIGTAALAYTGVGNMFFTADDWTGGFQSQKMLYSAPNGTLYNFSGVKQAPGSSESFVILTDTVAAGFTYLGTIKNVTLSMRTNRYTGGFGGFGRGLEIDNSTQALVHDVRFEQWSNLADTVFLKINGETNAIRIDDCVFDTQFEETALGIVPTLPDDVETLLIGNQFLGAGEPLKIGTSNDIISIIQILDSGAVASISDVSGDAHFISVGHGLSQFQQVVHTAFVDSEYNGTFLTDVIDNDTYALLPDVGEPNVAYVGGGTGNFSSDVVRVSSTSTIGIVEGEPVNLAGTINYDGGSVVAGVIPNTSFIANKPFVANENPTLGTWNTGSLTPFSERVNSSGNVGLSNSRAYMGVTAQNSGMDDTPITVINQYENLDLAIGATGQCRETAGNSRWHLGDDAIASVVYDGKEAFIGTLLVTMSVQAASSTPNYLFRVFKNGTDDVGEIRAEVAVSSTSIGSVTLVAPIAAITDDEFRVQVACSSGTQNVQIRRFTMSIS